MHLILCYHFDKLHSARFIYSAIYFTKYQVGVFVQVGQPVGRVSKGVATLYDMRIWRVLLFV